MAIQEDSDDKTKVIFYAKTGEVHRLAAFQQIDNDQIQASLEKAEEYFRMALDFCEPAVISANISAWISAHLGVTYFSLADLVENSRRNICLNDAEKYLRAALCLRDHKEPRHSTSNYTWAWAHLGEVLTWQAFAYIQQAHNRKEYLTWALYCFGRAIDLDSHYVWAYAHRGLAHRINGIITSNVPGCLNSGNEAALRDFQYAVALDSSYYWAVANLSALYRERGLQRRSDLTKLQEAVEDLRLALEYFQYVTIRDPFLFVHMNLLDNDPIGIGANPPVDGCVEDLAARLFNQYRESTREFRRRGPTPETRAKIDKFLAA